MVKGTIKPRCWQAFPPLLAGWLLLLSAGLAAGEAATPQQRELFQEFLTLKPSGYDEPGAWMLGVWDTDSGLSELAPLPAGPGNAAAQFKRLEELFPSEQEDLKNGGEDSRGVSLLLEAAEIAECGLTPEHYPPFDRVTAKQPDYVVLRSYLTALLRRGERAQRQGNRQEAERCYRAALVCGRHLTRDRTSALVYITGIIFKHKGAQAMEAFWRRNGNTGQAEAARRYLAAMGEIMRLAYWKAYTAMSAEAGFTTLPCVIRVATGDKEPCWRKEAVARLAVLRHGALDRANKRFVRNLRFEQAAEEALSTVAAEDPDPSVRRFAVWAVLNATPEQLDGFTHVFE